MPIEISRMAVMTKPSLHEFVPPSLPPDGKLIPDHALNPEQILSGYEALVTTTRHSLARSDPQPVVPTPFTSDRLTIVTAPDNPAYRFEEAGPDSWLTDNEITGDVYVAPEAPLPDLDETTHDCLLNLLARVHGHEEPRSPVDEVQVSVHVPAIPLQPLPTPAKWTPDPIQNLREVMASFEQIKSTYQDTMGHGDVGARPSPVSPSGVDMSVAALIRAQAMQAKVAEAVVSVAHSTEHGPATATLIGSADPFAPFAHNELWYSSMP